MARIVMMLNRLVIGGAPLDTVQLAGFLSNHHEVYLIVGDKNDSELDAFFLAEQYNQLHLVHITDMQRSLNLMKDVRAFFHILKLLRKIRPDIVHTHGAKSGLLGRLAAYAVGVKIIIHTYHGHVFHSYFNSFVSSLIVFAERTLARISSKIIAISEKQKIELVEAYRICQANKIEVIKLGIEISKFTGSRMMERRTDFRQQYFVRDEEVAIGIVGRIVPIKGHAFFADITAELLRMSRKPLKFFVIGDGITRKDLEKIFLEKNIRTTYFPEEATDAQVIFTSWIVEIEKAMNGLDIILLTSLNEGTPVTLLEAQAASIPVVASDVGGVSEVVLHGKSGFVIKYGDLNAFVERLLLLIDDPSMRKKMGLDGKGFIEANHGKQQQFLSIEKLYRQLLEV
ncbi:MAG: glycosyltransferase [Chitinophagaceae bacterium]|nr:glycosyltransferase [Chitinophagaceae bacterium]